MKLLQRHKKDLLFITLCLLCALGVSFMYGCATTGGKPFTEWTAKQKAAYFMGIYNAQYDGYKAQVAWTDLTPAEKSVLKAKKDALTTVYPMIQAYDLLQAGGGIPSQAQEQEIMSMLDRLQRQAIRQAS